MKSILVYCGSSTSTPPSFNACAREVGTLLAKRSLRLIYGGGRTGLMGVLADTVMEQGGQVIGVIPKSMAQREVAHDGLTQLHIVETMHQRKAMMIDHADAIMALPGGLGTLEEWAEAMTWLQLGYHYKPCGLFNYMGYYDPLVQQLERMMSEQFLRSSWRQQVIVDAQAESLLDTLIHKANSAK